MEIGERETVIIVNEADLAEGFFLFGTTSEKKFKKVLRKVGKANVEELSAGGEWYEAKVDSSCLNLNNFAIGRRRKRTMSEEQRVTAGERLKKARTAKAKEPQP